MNQSCLLRCQISVHLDTAKVVGKFRQKESGHGSRNLHKECVTTHLHNLLVLKMDGAETDNLNKTVGIWNVERTKCQRVGRRGGRDETWRVTSRGATSSADLGVSSNYYGEIP